MCVCVCMYGILFYSQYVKFISFPIILLKKYTCIRVCITYTHSHTSEQFHETWGVEEQKIFFFIHIRFVISCCLASVQLLFSPSLSLSSLPFFVFMKIIFFAYLFCLLSINVFIRKYLLRGIYILFPSFIFNVSPSSIHLCIQIPCIFNSPWPFSFPFLSFLSSVSCVFDHVFIQPNIPIRFLSSCFPYIFQSYLPSMGIIAFAH